MFQRLLVLLGADELSGGFLEGPPPGLAETTTTESLTEQPGDQIGVYRLREQIGEGGFGVVFVAEQTKPVRRLVALKVIKPGMDSKEVIARFEAERQALALMNHPNIARVLDAGTTETGRPYFAMELVRGVPITEFCDQHRLSTKERLRIFVDACLAVQHAHQKGIIHRDIKPSNVMVTLHDHRPVAKVIDFGIAKATGRRLTEKTVYTAYGQMIGTPMYMSPEQAQLSGLDVDTRSDVYSLGVLAYELLTGSTPFNKETLDNAGFDEMRRIIIEEEPRRPSLQVSTLKAEHLTTVSDQRKMDFRRLSGNLKGELDWIVMKALEKDRARRYETAASLADDIDRYLKGDAVFACPPTVAYRIDKFFQRNRIAIAVAMAMLLTLVGGIAATSWQAMRATSALNRALKAENLASERLKESETARQDAQATLNFLYDLLEQPRPVVEGKPQPLALADLQAEIDDRKARQLDTDMLQDVYDFARSSESFAEIEQVVKARLSEQIQEVLKDGTVHRGRFSQLAYLADKVDMRRELLQTVRPIFANTLDEMITDILEGRDANLDEFNGVREITESAPSLVNQDLQNPVRSVFAKAIRVMTSVPIDELNSFRAKRVAAYRLLQMGRHLQLKEVVPLALRIAGSES